MNETDSVEEVQDYIRMSGFTFPVVTRGPGEKRALGKAYKVSAYPANYLIGPDGKVLWRSIGFDERAVRQALKDVGLE